MMKISGVVENQGVFVQIFHHVLWAFLPKNFYRLGLTLERIQFLSSVNDRSWPDVGTKLLLRQLQRIELPVFFKQQCPEFFE